MIDRDLAHGQFADLDAATAAMLVTAMAGDISTWTARLAEAAEAGDREGMHRARHTLTGLCGAFGAQALQQACNGGLSTAPDRAAMLAIGNATIAAIRDAAV